MTDYSHERLVQQAASWLRRQGCGIVFDDRFRAVCHTGEQPDAIGWRSDVSILIECKASRADFLADRKKPFREDPAQGMGDWRFFLTPPEVASPEELPAGWGLLHATARTVRKIHGVPGNMHWVSHKPFRGNPRSESQVMYSALRRMALLGHLSDVYDPLAESRQRQRSDLERDGERFRALMAMPVRLRMGACADATGAALTQIADRWLAESTNAPGRTAPPAGASESGTD